MSSAAALARHAGGPTFVELAGHPIRWELLCELARSDRKVRELAKALRQRQGLISYHLGRLRSARLVTARRSAADGRDAYYTLDLARCRDLIAATAEALHPGLRLQPAPAPEPGPVAGASPARILFLCTGNSARSQMAEALVGTLGGGLAVGVSAGSHPKDLHPHAVGVMKERGLDISAWRAKSLDEFRDQEFDIVVTLCDRVREVCPEFPGAGRLVHWSIPDPSTAAAPDDDPCRAFREVADDLATRISFLLRDLPTPSPAPRTYQLRSQHSR